MAKIGTVTSVPFGMCTPLIVMSFLHSLLNLNNIKNNQIVDKHIIQNMPPTTTRISSRFCGGQQYER